MDSWLDAEVDGRSVRFWIAVGVAIAIVVLGFGAGWVWGLGRGMPTDGMAMDDMPYTGMPPRPTPGSRACGLQPISGGS